ncbi:MAG: serine/threonine-protein kinase [Polyangiaceae bacterium]
MGMMAVGPREPLAQRIGPYEVLLDLGSGGMGTISLARATGDDLGAFGFTRLVAIKRPIVQLAADPEVRRLFLDEARLLAQVHHANVVGVHQIGSDAAGHFLVLDYIEGGTLEEMLTRGILHRKKLSPSVVLRIMCDALAGLHAVHEAADLEGRPLQALHCDVSAENVLVGRDGVARIADLGIAKAGVASARAEKLLPQGRVPYLAPECLRRGPVDRRLDVYAAGVTMWTALAGRLPWGDASEDQMVRSIVLDGVPGVASSGVVIAPAIEEIVTRACDRDPSKRFSTARDMLAAIEALGRRTGWIATSAEVAAEVEELLGMEIRARRSAIAARLSPAVPRALNVADVPPRTRRHASAVSRRTRRASTMK